MVQLLHYIGAIPELGPITSFIHERFLKWQSGVFFPAPMRIAFVVLAMRVVQETSYSAYNPH